MEYFDDEAIEIEVPMDRYELPDNLQFLVEERIKTFNNLAQAQLKLEAWDSALASIKQVLKFDPNNEKALFRKSKAFSEKGEPFSLFVVLFFRYKCPLDKDVSTDFSSESRPMS